MLEWAYDWLDLLLPYPWLNYQFMKNAFIAVLLVTPLFGLLGTMVVSNRMAFFSDSLGHGAFTGVALGVLLGGVKPMASLIVFSICFALFITYIKNRSRSSADTIIGVFSSMAIAVGLMIMSYGGSFNRFTGFLIGDLLSITPEDLSALAVVFCLVVGLWLVLFNRLLIVSVNPSLAVSRGFNAPAIEMLFAASLAVVVSVSIQWVGILIINSLLVLPAATARNVAGNARQYHFIAVITAVFSGVSGLILSYYCNTAASATIVLVASLCFFAALICHKRR